MVPEELEIIFTFSTGISLVSRITPLIPERCENTFTDKRKISVRDINVFVFTILIRFPIKSSLILCFVSNVINNFNT